MMDDLKKNWSQAAADLLKTPSGTMRLLLVVVIGFAGYTWYQDRETDRDLKTDYFAKQIAATDNLTEATDKLMESSATTREFQLNVTSEHEVTDGKVDLAQIAIQQNAQKLDMLIEGNQQTNKLISVVISLLESSAARHVRDIGAPAMAIEPGPQ